MNATSNSLPAIDRVRAARDLALQRLAELQSPDGSWPGQVESNVLPTALFIIMLRTTGLIEKPGQRELESRLLRDIARFTNSDGGFWKFPGASSSKRLTLLAVTMMRLASGPCEVLARAEQFLAHGKTDASWERDLDLLVVAPLMAVHAGFRRPLLLSYLPRPRWPSRHLHFFWHCGWPGLNILLGSRHAQEYAAQIRQTQDPSGGWAIGSYVTMFNVMALVKAGATTDDPAVTKAHESLLRDFINERGVAAWRGHVVNTGYGLDSCLRAQTARMRQEALAFLLGVQTSDGGFAWGTSLYDTDADATAHVLRGFPGIAESALRRGVEFMLARQNRDGGFGAWTQSPVAGRRGSFGVLLQFLFDMPTADVTGRVVEVLASAEHPDVQKALAFFRRTQCRNGGWWSRWWAGYLAGTSFVLRAYAALGLCDERAVAFLLHHQNADGGWGETIRSDEDIRYAGQGDSTPLHTAHITSTLLRLGHPPDSPVIGRAIEYLLATMSPDGRWHDDQCTFSIVARCLYYRYEFLNYVLPLDALTDYLRANDS
ncbi:MAG: hypothetical protein LW698_14905 [Planctomycetaceae bacterium]|jgi:prenyltransferase beta subunit|nr:hypothetical protein [Planctomycetaceae bacterium]